MDYNFKYIENFEAGREEQTILLHNRIGPVVDENGVFHDGISGEQFAQEMKFLNQQKSLKLIKVRINSQGGSVLEGYSIISAILSSEKTVHTYIDGVAASIAAIIALAGERVFMYDFGTLMIHNPASDSPDISDEILSFVKATLVKIITNRTPRNAEEIAFMMDATTWLNAIDALNGGFVDEIVNSNKGDFKVNTKDSLVTIAAMYEGIINEIKPIENNKEKPNNNKKPIRMEKLTTLLNLSEGTEENVIVDNVKNLQDELTETKETLTQKEAEITALTEQLNEANGIVETNVVTRATELVENAIKEGKIKAEAKESFVNLAKSDFDTVKNTFEGIVSSKKAPNIMATLENSAPKGRETWTIRDWDKKDPKGLEVIKNSTPEVYTQMYNDYYKK